LQLAPPAAVRAGAAWKLRGDPVYSTATNYTLAVTSTNAVVVEFLAIDGWNPPTNQTYQILPHQLTTNTAFYTPTNPVLLARSGFGLGLSGTTGTTYRIERRSALRTGAWTALTTNAIVSNGVHRVLPWPLTNGPASFYRAVWLP
jgi:hypothetical protein